MSSLGNRKVWVLASALVAFGHSAVAETADLSTPAAASEPSAATAPLSGSLNKPAGAASAPVAAGHPETAATAADGAPQKAVAITEEAVAQHPELLKGALNAAIDQGNVDAVRYLLPRYRQSENPDRYLILYGEAMLARADGRLSEAVSRYRSMIAEHPEFTPTRLQLAITLFENKDDVAAQDQFEKIRSDQTLPPQVIATVNQYLEALQKRRTWTFDMNVQYLQDDNLNNASSKNWGVFTPVKISGHGVGYTLSAGKVWPFAGGWNAQTLFTLNGQSYWDAHRYDQLTARLYGGFGRRSLRTEWAVLPFVEKKWVGNDPYATAPGLRVLGSHWLSPRWQIAGMAEYSRKLQQQAPELNGHLGAASATVAFIPNPKQSWVAGLDISRETATLPGYTYNRAALRAAWNQEWLKGLSTSVSASAGKRYYSGATMHYFYSSPRQDNEYTVSTSVWLRNLHFLGLTPRLTYQWQQNTSNEFMFNYKKAQVYLEVGKTF